jgi:protein TonB
MRTIYFLAAMAAWALTAGAAAAAEPARAKANLAAFFTDADYPAEAIAAKEQGEVGFTLEVGADGRVAGCLITRSSGSSALDSATCRVLGARARFTPARDSNGMPAQDRVAGRIRWTLPAPPAAG